MSETYVDVSHEALIRGWPRLRDWLDEDRAGLLLHQQITQAAEEWQCEGRENELLYRGTKLNRAQGWRQHNDAELNSLERQFLDESLRLKQRERAVAQKLAQAEEEAERAALRENRAREEEEEARTEPSDSPENAAAPLPGVRLVPQMLIMLRAFWASPERTKIVLLGVAIVVVIGATAYGQVMLNAWNRPFYDAIARKDLRGFLVQLTVFGGIAGGLLVLNVAQTWLKQATKVKLREGLVRDLFDEWLRPRRAFHLAKASKMGANPDQRIHEDARNLTELSTDLGIDLLQSTLFLGSFSSVLWALSQNVIFHLSGRSFIVPGYMVWCALASAAAASWLSWLVGRPLIQLNSEQYAQEANLRFAIVRLDEHIDGVAFYGGEAEEKRRLTTEFYKVIRVMWRIVNAKTRLTWITAGNDLFTIIAPVLVAAPAYLGGDLSFGGLMMAVGAFIQVQRSLRWFIDNFNTVLDWRPALVRITRFRETVAALDRLGATENCIEFVAAPNGKLTIEHLQIATPTGCTALSEQPPFAPAARVLERGRPVDAGLAFAFAGEPRLTQAAFPELKMGFGVRGHFEWKPLGRVFLLSPKAISGLALRSVVSLILERGE